MQYQGISISMQLRIELNMNAIPGRYIKHILINKYLCMVKEGRARIQNKERQEKR
jgi:hypothetical protein